MAKQINTEEKKEKEKLFNTFLKVNHEGQIYTSKVEPLNLEALNDLKALIVRCSTGCEPYLRLVNDSGATSYFSKEILINSVLTINH